MTVILILIPWLLIPVLLGGLFKKFNWNQQLSYLLTALFVPLWTLLLTFLNVLTSDGYVLTGTSVLVIPFALFINKLTGRFLSLK